MDWDKIKQAYEAVENGIAKRIDVDSNVIIYKAGTVIRMDVKGK